MGGHFWAVRVLLSVKVKLRPVLQNLVKNACGFPQDLPVINCMQDMLIVILTSYQSRAILNVIIIYSYI